MTVCSIDGCDRTGPGSMCNMHYKRVRKNGTPGGVAPQRVHGDLLTRLSDKFTVGDDCWQWVGRLSGDGYGQIRGEDGGFPVAHRVVYELMVGPIPEGLTLDHLCRNRSCVRPGHLEPVTQRENVLRGEGVAAKRAAQTHCKNGHELTPENIYCRPSRPGRERACRVCIQARVQ